MKVRKAVVVQHQLEEENGAHLANLLMQNLAHPKEAKLDQYSEAETPTRPVGHPVAVVPFDGSVGKYW